jgi:hypothetical protein
VTVFDEKFAPGDLISMSAASFEDSRAWPGSATRRFGIQRYRRPIVRQHTGPSKIADGRGMQ